MLAADSLPWDSLAAAGDCAAQGRLQGGPKRRRSGCLGRSSAELGRTSSTRQQQRPGRGQPLRACKTASRCQPEPEPQPASPTTDRQRFLLRYAQEVTPDIIASFEEQSPEYVGEAMRETISRLLGELPEEYFNVSVSATRSENLAQLCYSVVMTGVLFANTQQRLELQASMSDLAEREAIACEMLAACRSEANFAEGSQKDQVAGHVLRWRHDSGLQAIPAQDYISSLERQIATLRRQVAKDLYLQARSNPLLSYLQTLEAPHLAELSAVSGDIREAVNSVVRSVMEASDMEQGAQQRAVRAGELASLLYWLAIVGFVMRSLEARWDLEQTMLLG